MNVVERFGIWFTRSLRHNFDLLLLWWVLVCCVRASCRLGDCPRAMHPTSSESLRAWPTQARSPLPPSSRSGWQVCEERVRWRR